ncbi:HET domain protein [Zopfia rhizophila CBS 207.26]|uniref:HET domain protein n=1 Tax=Zopfia rhizophila CBS 207.26 TaxID=1314779 RepID=A0A6A6E7S5_9PEZI|nr:HET domain protein [Zopfia rhizophila CBS 207.26]
MRLLSSTRVELEAFPDDRIPKYAILSHRWGDDEVSFQDIQNATAIQRAGYIKIKLCCDQAAKDGLQYVWVDTCCIDKSSSAELTESINSMYRWYQNAAVCYAYLFDVQSLRVSNDSSFINSAWFTRGWTLQELIAPSNVEFYNSTWHKLGTKENLKDTISAITGIDIEVLRGVDPENFSIAKRMSWAFKRTTTKVEDVAYSLLGLFGVNMPMLYGEGERAFIRLQEEIMKQSDDHSLFAWSSSDSCYRGLLAKSPADFRDCSNIISSRSRLNRAPYSVTNIGISIQLPMVTWAMNTCLAALDCEVEGVHNSRVGIFLAQLPENDQWARVLLDGTDNRTFESELIPKSQYKIIYVRQKVWGSRPPMDKMYGFWLRKFPPFQRGENSRFEVTSWNQWNDKERIFKIPAGSCGTAGVLWYTAKDMGSTVLKLGFDTNFNPVCQFGGALLGPRAIRAKDRTSFDVKMDTDWIDSGSDSVFRGDRQTGLNVENPWTRILITEEVIENQRVWVVYITPPEEGAWHAGVKCDGCNLAIYGTRFKCLVCPDFDYCDDCILTCSVTHPSHDFQTIKPARHPGISCDGCNHGIYGTRFKCLVCDNFDYCSNCILTSGDAHPSHDFQAIEK